MPRYLPNKSATKGSQYHLQRLVNSGAETLDAQIAQALKLDADDHLIWKSPLATDDFAEYGDDAFLALLGIASVGLPHSLNRFWAARGPQWDGLALTGSGKLILVEAKSHASEIKSSCTAKSPTSLAKISSTLQATQRYFNSGAPIDRWLKPYYQYANRLAHLYWLRALNHLDTHLIFICFANDATISAPLSADQWMSEMVHIHDHLGIGAVGAAEGVHHVIVDV
jgi:hypothetical protein